MGSYEKGESFTPDSMILESPRTVRSYHQVIDAGSESLVNNEELGNEHKKGECTCEIFPPLSDLFEPAHKMVKAVFLIRDPIRVSDSWKNVGGTYIDSTIACFQNLFRMQREAQEGSCWLIYEKLVRYKDDEIERICKHWGIAYSPDMLELEKAFDSFILNRKAHLPREEASGTVQHCGSSLDREGRYILAWDIVERRKV
jgi:hypothetical protein